MRKGAHSTLPEAGPGSSYPILVDQRFVARGESSLRRQLRGSRLVTIRADGAPAGEAGGAEVAFPFTSSPTLLHTLLAAVPTLRYLHFPFAGMEQVLAARLPSRLLLTSSAGVHAIPIAEYVVAAIMAMTRRLPLFWARQRQRRWKSQPLQEVLGRRVGIYGYGAIGREVARRCVGLGMEVWGLRRTGEPDPLAARMLRPRQLPQLLAASDYLVVAAALTPQTRGRIDARALASLKPGSYVLNVSRGAIIDERALVRALRRGHVAGAYLDVFAEEPVPRSSPLWRAPNCYLTPHVSWSSLRTEARVVALFAENVRRFRSGEPLLNRVDRRRGY
jgi:phosphoglycerate dehydrogenase-like enzyme